MQTGSEQELFSLAQLVLAVLGIIASVVISAFVVPYVSRRTTENAQKQELLLRLLQIRALPFDPHFQGTIAAVPIIFAKHACVLRKYSLFLASAGKSDAYFSDTDYNEKLTDLIAEISFAAGTGISVEQLKQNFYVPKALDWNQELQRNALFAVTDIAKELKRSNANFDTMRKNGFDPQAQDKKRDN